MAKILIAECKQEVSSFNPVESDYDYFSISIGAELIAFHSEKQTEIRGAIDTLSIEEEIQIVPVYGARSNSAGPLKQESFERIVSEFKHSLLSHADQADALLVCLHGAMACTEETDPEGHIISEARNVLGDDIPIVITLDLHGILTEKMLQNINGLTVYHTYPHIDFVDTGHRAAELLLSILRGANPVISRVKIPALVRGNELITATGIYGESIRYAQRLETDPRVLAAGMMIGNPFTDVPELCCQSVVVTDGEPELAELEALQMAQDFWGNRKLMQPKLIDMDQAVLEASESVGPVIFTDAADATSSGATGDSNALLQALIEGDYAGEVLAPIVDPSAAYMAHSTGTDKKLKVVIGGALDSRYSPLELDVTVEKLGDGEYCLELSGKPEHAGPSAVLKCGNYTIVCLSRSVQFIDRSPFFAHDINPENFDLVIVKSPHCEPRFFDDWAEKNFNIDAPGSTSANLKTLGHNICGRPLYPIDSDVNFTSSVETFQ